MQNTSRRSGGWLSNVVTLSLVALVLSVCAVRSEAQRSALWRVVQSCVLDHDLTGGSLPCLNVRVSDGDDRGFVILSPPFGEPDTILSPTRRIVGVEDPWLRSAEAPNYFEDAWEARDWLPARARAAAQADFAMGVNSPWTRSQDQLHIHMGCASTETREMLNAAVSRLSPDKWTRLKTSFLGIDVWARLVAQDSLKGVNVFRLAADGVPDPSIMGTQSTLVVSKVALPAGGSGFVVMIPRHTALATRKSLHVEPFIDADCRGN